MKKAIFLFIVLFSFMGTTHGQTAPGYDSTLKHMLEVSGSEESFKSSVEQMLSMFKQQYSEVPEAIWTDLENEFLKTSMQDLVEMLSPVYQKHLSEEDLKGLIAFYQTPVGKKYAEKTPLIIQESMQVGQQWGMKIAQGLQEKVQEKGY